MKKQLLILVAMVLFCGAANANLIANPDFEASNPLESWHYSDPGVAAVSDNGPSAPGVTAIEVEPGKDLRSFTAPAVAGREYTLTWDYKKAGGNRPQVWLRFFDASGSFLGQKYWGFPNRTSWYAVPFGHMSQVAPANSATLDVRFNGGAGTEKLYIDNVSVVPEPATLLLLGAGGLVTAIRRRK